MRRFLFGAGCYFAGIMTLPMLSIGVSALSARSVSHETRSQPYQGLVAAYDSAAACEVALPAAGNCRHSAAIATLELTDAVAEADTAVDEDFAPAAATPEVSPFDEAADVRAAAPNPPIVRGGHFSLPIGPEALATSAQPDEAAAAKLKEIRETLKKVVDEKVELLSQIGLEAELKTHQAHLAELKSLKELLALKQNLQELRDKFPESDAGRRATQLLQLLDSQQQQGPFGPTPIAPAYIPFAPEDPQTYRPRDR